MKYIKTYESIQNGPTTNNYVIVDPNNIRSEPTVPKIKEMFHDFINNNIGQIKDWYFSDSNNTQKIFSVIYLVEPPKKLKQFFMYDSTSGKYMISIRESKIIYFSDNIEDVEIKIRANKYNL